MYFFINPFTLVVDCAGLSWKITLIDINIDVSLVRMSVPSKDKEEHTLGWL